MMQADLMRELTRCGIPWSSEVVDKLSAYYAVMSKWNLHTNLTTITEPRDFIIKHICDSVYPLHYYDFANKTLIDVGSGAGFPGLPLKIFCPDLNLYLLDASAKRVAFLRHCCAQLALNVEIQHGRAEELGRDWGRERFDIAVTRAVANLAVISEYCLPLLRIGGSFLAYKGPGSREEVERAERAVALLGGAIKGTHSYRLPSGDERSLIIVEKTNLTPAQYPRRPGHPVKKPL